MIAPSWYIGTRSCEEISRRGRPLWPSRRGRVSAVNRRGWSRLPRWLSQGGTTRLLPAFRFTRSARREDDEPPVVCGGKIGAPDAAQLNGGVHCETSNLRYRERPAQRASEGAQRDLLLGAAREHAVEVAPAKGEAPTRPAMRGLRLQRRKW